MQSQALFEPQAVEVGSKPSLYDHKPLRSYDEENMADLRDDSMVTPRSIRKHYPPLTAHASSDRRHGALNRPHATTATRSIR